MADIDIEAELKALLATHSVKDASSLLTEKTGLPRKELYALAVKLKNNARE